MYLTDVATFKANLQGNGPGKISSDAEARILLAPDEVILFPPRRVGWVNPASVQANDEPLTEFNGGANTAGKMEWWVTLTDKHIQFWSPQSVGMMGGVMLKPGKATGGQFAYKIITGLDVFEYGANEKFLNVWTKELATTKLYAIQADAATLAWLSEQLCLQVAKVRGAGRRDKLKAEECGFSHPVLDRFCRYDWSRGGAVAIYEMDTSGTLELVEEDSPSYLGESDLDRFMEAAFPGEPMWSSGTEENTPSNNKHKSMSTKDAVPSAPQLAADPAKKFFCSQCGKQVDSSDTFCGGCGVDLRLQR